MNTIKYNKIKLLAKDKIVEKLLYNIVYNEEDRKDLSQDIYEIICKYDDDKINNMSSKDMSNFILTVAKTQVHSITSPYYKQYKFLDDHSNREFEIDNDNNVYKKEYDN